MASGESGLGVSGVFRVRTDPRLWVFSCSDQARDQFLTQRFGDQQLAAWILEHHKQQPLLAQLAHQPFVCWMVAVELERCFHLLGSTLALPVDTLPPPRLTPFYVSILIVQTNRSLENYSGAENTRVSLKWSAISVSVNRWIHQSADQRITGPVVNQ